MKKDYKKLSETNKVLIKESYLIIKFTIKEENVNVKFNIYFDRERIT